jgi:hypothetical protein
MGVSSSTNEVRLKDGYRTRNGEGRQSGCVFVAGSVLSFFEGAFFYPFRVHRAVHIFNFTRCEANHVNSSPSGSTCLVEQAFATLESQCPVFNPTHV